MATFRSIIPNFNKILIKPWTGTRMVRSIQKMLNWPTTKFKKFYSTASQRVVVSVPDLLPVFAEVKKQL